MFKALTIRSNQTNRDDEESNLGDKQTSGPGLGLTFCKSMIERLGGRIWYDPEVKVGTIFHIKFPARAVTEEEVKSQVFGEKSTESILIEKLQRLQMRSDQNKRMRDGGRDTLNRTANNLVKSSNRTHSTLYDISSQERTARGNTQVSPEPLSKQRSASSSLAPVNSSAQETVKEPQPKALPEICNQKLQPVPRKSGFYQAAPELPEEPADESPINEKTTFSDIAKARPEAGNKTARGGPATSPVGPRAQDKSVVTQNKSNPDE